MGTGALTVSLALLPLALLTSALSDLMLGTIFMAAAKQLSQHISEYA